MARTTAGCGGCCTKSAKGAKAGGCCATAAPAAVITLATCPRCGLRYDTQFTACPQCPPAAGKKKGRR